MNEPDKSDKNCETLCKITSHFIKLDDTCIKFMVHLNI